MMFEGLGRGRQVFSSQKDQLVKGQGGKRRRRISSSPPIFRHPGLGAGVLSLEIGCVFVARGPTSRWVPARNHRSTVTVAGGQRAIQASSPIEGALPPRLVTHSSNFRSEPELQRKSSFGCYPNAIIVVGQLGQLSEDLVESQSHTHCRRVSEGESSHTRAEKLFTLPHKKRPGLFFMPLRGMQPA